MSAAQLAIQPNAVFGILVAIEVGRPIDGIAERAGLRVDELENILQRAREGELPRVKASSGEGRDSARVFEPSFRQHKPAPAPLQLAAPKEPQPMTQVQTGVGTKPKLDWVDVELIDVDAAYQREADDKSVKRIVAEFRWDHFGAVVLAPHSGGRFTVTDGQHRVRAAQLHPEVTHVPALITAIAGTAAEAENFLVINRARRAVSTIEIYWAGIASLDPATLKVRDAVEAAGCGVVRSQANYKAGQTGAVSAIARCLQSYGDIATIRALKVVRQAWPNDAKALRGTLITALARIYRANEIVSDERMIKVLAPRSFAELTAHAEAFRKLSGGSADTVLARTITEIFNKGLSANTIFFGESR